VSECTPERFAKDVANHVMIVKLDSGLDRRLKFRNPTCSAYWFEIVTWPGALCIHGDMGTYVFSRLDDMFKFFRSEEGKINRSYWAEKLQGDYRGRSSRGMEFSMDLFRAAIKDQFRRSWKGKCYSKEAFDLRRECWDEVKDQLLAMSDDGEDYCIRAVMDYRFDMPRGTGMFSMDRFEFHDFWENSFHEFTFHFTWCCRAIVWAIEQYDAAKAAAERGADTANA
jgi:hypothetical protein